MLLQETPEQQSFRKEVREYFANLMTDDVRDALRGAHETSPVRRELFKKMGSDGMLGIGWPTEYGGQGRPPTDQFIFYDESVRACPNAICDIEYCRTHTHGNGKRRTQGILSP